MKSITIILGLLGCLLACGAITNLQAQIVYKVPDGTLIVDWTESKFKGMIMLEKDNPSGLFIAYPNEGETVDQLRERAAAYIAPMVVSDTKEKKTIPFEIKAIASHSGDIDGRAKYYFFKGEKTSVQILFFERKTKDSTVLYGYFASKDNDKDKSKIWVGADMKDPKLLSKFIKSFK